MSNNNNAKKKQEEKHLKTLREFLSLPANKNCFDCNQRGPTYVNATIGSFVCISCSGKLRGLTPPHRVKSISMASFTVEEIDFLRSRGNEYCKQVWMALYNGDVTSETKDDQRFKDHLTAKYEKKRWYVEPSAATRSLPQMKVNGSSSQPVERSPQLIQQEPRSPQSPPQAAAKSSDLLADLDFFVGPSSVSPRRHPSVPQSLSQPSFANFQNADFFVAAFPTGATLAPAPQPAVAAHHLNCINALVNTGASNLTPPKDAPSQDRYSALKDLDALFTTQQQPPQPQPVMEQPSVNWATSWNGAAAGESHFGTTPPASAWAGASFTSAAPSTHSSNPFLAVAPALPGQQQQQQQQQHPVPMTSSQSANFGRPALPWANFSSPHGNSQFNGVNGASIGVTPLTSSQSLNLSPKTWNSSPAGHNPFMESSSFGQNRSHNPFL